MMPSAGLPTRRSERPCSVRTKRAASAAGVLDMDGERFVQEPQVGAADEGLTVGLSLTPTNRARPVTCT